MKWEQQKYHKEKKGLGTDNRDIKRKKKKQRFLKEERDIK